MTSALRQVGALVRLRWQMVRSPGVRWAISLTGLFLLWLLVALCRSGDTLSAPSLAAALALAPAAFLGFGALAVIAPLTAGGGNEILPPDQLVAYPVRPMTQFLCGLVLAPVNLVWVLQLLALAAETAYLTLDGSFAAGAVTTAAFVAGLTVAGQAVAWTVAGLRQSRNGRRAVTALVAAVIATAALVIRAGYGDAVLDRSPTRTVVRAIEQAPHGPWAATTAALVALTAVALVLGRRACAWALHRPGDAGIRTSTSSVRRRPGRRTTLRELNAVDRASVWRAPALRRGALVLGVLPGVGAVGAGVPWESLIVLPGLVAAGAGLLFGVNLFCLDGSGAVWLASLPHDPLLLARSKLRVLAETVGAAVLLSIATGSLRSPGSPSAAELVGIAASGIATSSLVIATCMALSVHHPHRAELRGPRDAVAPPGALVLASVRLALPAGAVGVVIAGAAQIGIWWVPLAFAAPVAAGAAIWLRSSLQAYAAPHVRARVVSAVATG